MNITKLAEAFGIASSDSDVKDIPHELPKPLPEKKVFAKWKAPSRSVRNHFGERFMRSGIIIGVVVILLLALMGEFAVILAIASLVFVTSVLMKSTPEDVEY